MKNNIYILFLLLLSCFVAGCEEELDDFTGPYRLTVAGPSSGTPGALIENSLGSIQNPDSYTWSIVEGPGVIEGPNTGDTVAIRLQSVGTVVLNVTNGTDSRTRNITVKKVPPKVTTVLEGTGVLRSGQEATVTFKFASPLAKDPTLAMITDATAFTSGELSNLTKVDDKTYTATYTAGEGNGTPKVRLGNIIATSTFGSDTIVADTIKIYRIDNVAPIADLTYSQNRAMKGSTVTVTATFSEPVMFEDPADSAIYASFSGGGVQAERDTLQPTDDPLVYTYEYTVTGEGDGPVTVNLENVSDLARNPLAATGNKRGLVVDNTAPEILVNTATDEGTYASIKISSSEPGTGMFVIMEGGKDAPETVADFMAAEGVASGSIPMGAGFPETANRIVVPNGEYTVYYLVQDLAGNFSEIASSSLTMN